MRGRTVIFASWVVVLMVWPCPLRAEVTIKDPGTFVVDKAGIIDDAVEKQMEGWLRELEQKTTAQVKVLTVNTIEGEDWFGFVQRHAELWKLGQKGKDNGVLIALTLKERQDRIHVGYGLEGVLPDGWCGTLRREVFIPHFKKSDFSGGLFGGTVAIANKIADENNVQLTGIPAYRHTGSRRSDKFSLLQSCCSGVFILFWIFFGVIAQSARRHSNYRRWGGGLLPALFIGSMLGGSRGRSGWGGGGGGFGGGSFGGGGGFGGGGAGGGGW